VNFKLRKSEIMDKNRMLAVVTHPDDEFGFAGILLHAKSRGDEIHMVCVTKGEAGQVRNEKIDLLKSCSIAEIRSKEFLESCKVLNADSYSFLGLLDGESSVWDEIYAIDRLKEQFERVDPTHVISFDKNGFNGHPDHIATTNLTEKVLSAYTHVKWIQLTKYSRAFLSKKLWYLPLVLKNKIIEKACTNEGVKTKIHKLNPKEHKVKMSLLGIYSSQFPDGKNRYYSHPRWIVQLMSKYESILLTDSIDSLD
jgi:LmbE family N-acetylglucosaminyl deacetylase